ncbi:hypothetical protein [Nonomuraea sp. NPDC049480]|uniref:hypothetical protein n=1 Tax=Nonomuraea sp. NPDC049480 TaxID=3364353 RepID=UPI003792E6AF
MADAPIVRLLDHPSEAGYLLEWRKTGEGWEARVSWMEIVPGPQGGLKSQEGWLPARQVEPLPSEDYSRVPRTRR